MSKSWASTLKLPKSAFPPRPLPELRPLYLQRATDDFYKWQEAHRPAHERFVLHDGPPYANGRLHVGHALNKILKDMTLRVKVQQGRRVHYVPGWDCHGLPIEIKALAAVAATTADTASAVNDRDSQKDKNNSRRSGGSSSDTPPSLPSFPPLTIRRAARDLAARTVLEQMQAFRSFSVMADWAARWTTMDPAYEIRQLRLFQQLVRAGLIDRRYRPVYWSPTSRTALAEAELEYRDDHRSRAAFVKLPLVDTATQTAPAASEKLAGYFDGAMPPLFAVIWTTTPWTLPANEAVAVHRDLAYAVVEHNGAHLLVAEACLDTFVRVCCASEVAGATDTGGATGGSGAGEASVASTTASLNIVARGLRGADLVGLRYTNPLRGRHAAPQPIVHADFVSPDTGSGLVHVAPGHGFEDYELGVALGLPVPAPVDGAGCFTADAYPDAPDHLAGLPVQGAGQAAVLALLGDARAWGVPIPALVGSDGRVVLTDATVAHIVDVMAARGTDAWWADAVDEPAWIPPTLQQAHPGVTFHRGTDTMDVWFDSGSSWTQMPGGGAAQADVYLEGTDQHRGWFQSSLLTRVAALRGATAPPAANEIHASSTALAPFKTLVTHGFLLDGKGRKMSKSLGNVVTPEAVMDGTLLPPLKPKKGRKKKAEQNTENGLTTATATAIATTTPAVAYDALGPDALRLWVAGSDYRGDVVISETVLQATHTALIKYRVILKMLLGSLDNAAAAPTPLTKLDHIALLQLQDTLRAVGLAYDRFEFYKGVAVLNRWLAVDVSAFYLEAAKDRLYCADGGGVLAPLFVGLLRMLAPVTPLLVEEAWDHAPSWLKDSTEHPLRQLYTAPLVGADQPLDPDAERSLRQAIPVVYAAHAAVKAALERARNDKVLGSSLQCTVVLQMAEAPQHSEAAEAAAVTTVLEDYADELATMFVVSSVALHAPMPDDGAVAWRYSETFEVAGATGTAWVLPPQQAKCPRCWRYVADEEDHLCGRCADVMAAQQGA
ncbi:Isoleucyl-tRNA synthetase, type 1 [Niveomyces insectorum RCEF 264]|uniref:isoleucine--tRNA ligase n=1 Tax=Niveomyces insectorum RCEF 264 TaxID=1081102 RepID=A0A167N9Z0_9HYPO|nr:Isoleucyl-tRNA synthetase, type 1 [Niveomyces insectorum RCEF 264]